MTYESHSAPFRELSTRDAAVLDRKLAAASSWRSGRDLVGMSTVESLFDCPSISRVRRGVEILSRIGRAIETLHHVWTRDTMEVNYRAGEEMARQVSEDGGCITGFDVRAVLPSRPGPESDTQTHLFQAQYLVDDWVYLSYAGPASWHPDYMCDGDRGLDALVDRLKELWMGK